MMNRRRFLHALGLAAAGSALPGAALAQCLADPPLQWRNWSGNQRCSPRERFAPAGERELADWLARTAGPVRPVGSGHSFSALVPTDGSLLSLGRLSGLLRHDPATHTATFGAGTLLSQTGPALQRVGLGLRNMSDIDYQALGGLLATSTHGTGIRFGSMSTDIVALKLVTPAGAIIEIDRARTPALFHAARVSLGALGVMSEVTLQCQPAFRLREHFELRRTEEFLEQVDELVRDNDHWEMLPLIHSDYAAGVWLNETDEPATDLGDEAEEGGNEFVELIRMLHKYGSDFPAIRRGIMNAVAGNVSFGDRIGNSYEIFANVRSVRFNEMEYQVPAEAGPACLREILHTIHNRNLPVWMPMEYRYVKGDDIWISQFQGRDSASISVHQHFEMDHHNYFSVIEPIFWKYDGRPHWGKYHTLNARQLRRLYPHFDDFLEVREQLDPQGKMLNAHLRSVLGV